MEEYAEMKSSLRAKFYLLTVPLVVILVALAAFIMAPYSQVQNLVTQIKEALAECIGSEGFARHYERQLRECAAFVLTGSEEHEKQFEQARQLTGVDLENWIAAEKRHTGDTPSHHAEELAAQNKVKTSYEEVNRSCDWAIALSRSGRRDEAIASLEEAVDGPSGSAISSIMVELLPEEEAQLNGYLDNLQGAVKSVTMLRLLGLESNVESMKVHATSVVLAERFARYFNAQVKESLVFIAGGRPQDEVEFRNARSEASETLDLWEEQAGPAPEAGGPAEGFLVDRRDKKGLRERQRGGGPGGPARELRRPPGSALLRGEPGGTIIAEQAHLHDRQGSERPESISRGGHQRYSGQEP